MRLPPFTFVVLLCLAPAASAQIVDLTEAESATVRHADGRAARVHDSILASSRKRVGDFWGERAGDEVRWTVKLSRPLDRARLAIRYSFHQAHYESMRGKRDLPRALELLLNDRKVADVPVPDTGNWDDFQSTFVTLPDFLPAGRHDFWLRSPADGLTTDLDAFTLFRGDPVKVLTPAHRSSIVARAPADDGRASRMTVRMTAKAVVRQTPEQILRDFGRIYDFFEDYMGWEPDRPFINIHIYEDALSTGTFENQHGIYFQASNFNWDRGNWIHEMNHVFDNGYFPHWTGHPMIRVNDTFVTGPGCFPELFKGPAADPAWAARLNAGRRLLASPHARTDDPHDVLYALYARYGKDLLRRFYAECRKAHEKGELKLVRGGDMTRDRYVTLMSRAAKQDVRPLFEQWTGFKDAK